MSDKYSPRVTVRVPESELDEIEELVADGVYPNQSEAIRDGIRKMLKSHRQRPKAVADGGEDRGDQRE